MEALSETLQPYKDSLGQVASIVTIGQFFSGAFICKDIYKAGSTKGVSATPFLGGIGVGILMLKYALLLDDPAMLQVNVAAILLNAIYAVIYYYYSAKKWEEVLQPTAYYTAFVAALLGYAQVENSNLVEYRFGLIVTIIMLLLIASPLADLKEIIRKKDASSIPFPIVLMGTIVSFLWFLYGIILLNNFMIIQNIVGFLLCIAQMVLYVLYPKKDVSGGIGQGRGKKAVKKD